MIKTYTVDTGVFSFPGVMMQHSSHVLDNV